MQSYTSLAYRWRWLLALALQTPQLAHGYEPNCTHAMLSRRAAELYARHYGQTFSASQIDQLAQGSVHEDLAAIPYLRSTNHFYDIHNGRGWTAPVLAFVAPCLSEALFEGFFRTSKDWALTAAYQQISWTGTLPGGVGIICHYDGDYSWPTILSMLDMSAPAEKVAYAEGHILHLLQDLTVPAHTRNDTHLPLPGEKYELFAKDMCKTSQIPTANELYAEGVRPIVLSQLGDYFDTLATYTYSHYFSDDSKFSADYDAPFEKQRITIDVNGKKRTYIYAEDSSLLQYGIPAEYRLAGVNTRLEKYIPKDIAKYKELVYYLDDSCLSDYWRRLSRKAVAYTAGALRNLVLETNARSACKPACMPKVRRCNNSQVEECRADGCSWTVVASCPNLCANGQCASCASGVRERCWVECSQQFNSGCMHIDSPVRIMGVRTCMGGQWGACVTKATCDNYKGTCITQPQMTLSMPFECLDGNQKNGTVFCIQPLGAQCNAAYYTGFGPFNCPSDACLGAGDYCPVADQKRPCEVHCNTPDGPTKPGTQTCFAADCGGTNIQMWWECKTNDACL